MTSKEIATYTVADIERNCDTALGYGSWERTAIQMISYAFSAARSNRNMVTAVADEIIKYSYASHANVSYSRGVCFGFYI